MVVIVYIGLMEKFSVKKKTEKLSAGTLIWKNKYLLHWEANQNL